MKIQNSKFKIQNFGFTLIEAVVATSVFAFVVAGTLGVYMATLQLDSKTKAERAVAQNARFIMEFLAKEVRNGTINYNSTQNSTTLSLINQSQESEQISLTGQNLVLSKVGLGSTNINSSSILVTNMRFYLSPSVDPLTVAKLANQQPNVTVVLELTSNYGNKPTDTARINLQSTFSSRDYPTRQP